MPVVLSNGTPITFIYGDLDSDGETDSSDLLLMKLHIAGEKELEGKHLIAADLDDDGEFNSADLLNLKLKLMYN